MVLYSDWLRSSNPYDVIGIDSQTEMKLKVFYRLFRLKVGYQGWKWWKIKTFFNRHWRDIVRDVEQSWELQWAHFWCGMCGGTHRVDYLKDFYCTTINQTLTAPYIWRHYAQHTGDMTRMWEGKQDIFLAWDNLAKHNDTFEKKLETEKQIWTIMFNNAYDKHKNGQEKVKGCKECQKTDLHKPDFEKIYLTASWRE